VRRIRAKRPRIKLGTQAYERLRLKVLTRDGWRCQDCGSMRNLEVHHITFRSHSGDDSESNLITLCSTCHADMHL
jgi:5-methylcytosine-specific restriction endonuclease McrA